MFRNIHWRNIFLILILKLRLIIPGHEVFHALHDIHICDQVQYKNSLRKTCTFGFPSETPTRACQVKCH